MRIPRRALLAGAAGAAMLISPAAASAALTFNQAASSPEVPAGDNVTFTMTAGNTGPGTQQFQVGTLETRAFGEKAVQDPVQSITTDHGTCSIDPVQPPYNYHGATCDLSVPAGESAQIIEVVKVNESLDNLAGILASDGTFSSAFKGATVRANYPARVSGSAKIKLKGLPGGCVDRDFTVTASSKGAKKITAALAGPYDEWHSRLFGEGFTQKIGTAKGSKLKLDVPIARERAGFYDIKFAAKFENGPKQKADVNFQRCGIPDR